MSKDKVLDTILDSDFVFNDYIKAIPLSNLGLIAEIYDAITIGIEDIIKSCLKKVSSGVISKALTLQLLAVPYQTL